MSETKKQKWVCSKCGEALFQVTKNLSPWRHRFEGTLMCSRAAPMSPDIYWMNKASLQTQPEGSHARSQDANHPKPDKR